MLALVRFAPAVAVAAATLWAAAPAQAQDTIHRKSGGTVGKAGGVEIVDLTVTKIFYKLPRAGKQSIDTDKVKSYEFGEAPRVYDDGMAALDAGDYGTAAAKFAQGASRDHKQQWARPLCMFYRGEALRRGGAYARAIDAFEQYLAKYQDNIKLPDAQIGIGQCYLARGKKKEARAAFDKVAGGQYGEDKAIQGAIWNARVLEVEGKWAEAKAAYTKLERQAGATYKDIARQAGLRKNLSGIQLAIKQKDDNGLAGARRELKTIISAAEDPAIEAAAWNGVGETHFYATKPDWIEALIAFMHVRVRFAEYVDEQPKCLYHASHAYFNAADTIAKETLAEGEKPEEALEKAKVMGKILYGRLKREYPRDPWAKKPGPR